MKEDYQRALKKLTLFFVLNPVSFNLQSYQKQKRPETSDQSLFKFRNKFRNEREKVQKFEYLENEKSFLDEIKDTFHSF